MAQAHDCLTVDEILSHFSSRKAVAQEKYREFVQAGIHSPSLWEDPTAQNLLGVEGFAEAFRHLLAEKLVPEELLQRGSSRKPLALGNLLDLLQGTKLPRSGRIVIAYFILVLLSGFSAGLSSGATPTPLFCSSSITILAPAWP
jgi:hypothetical protein